jgi:hypothetical protein
MPEVNQEAIQSKDDMYAPVVVDSVAEDTYRQEESEKSFSLDDESLETLAQNLETSSPDISPKTPLTGTQNGVNTADLPDWLK